LTSEALDYKAVKRTGIAQKAGNSAAGGTARHPVRLWASEHGAIRAWFPYSGTLKCPAGHEF